MKFEATAVMSQTLLVFSVPAIPVNAENGTVQLNNIVIFAQSDPISASNFMKDLRVRSQTCKQADSSESETSRRLCQYLILHQIRL